MSQNISLWGATYSDVPSVVLPKSGGGTASFTDVTDTTAVASDVLSGKYFYLADGTKTAGTGTGGGGGGSVTQDQDGFIILPPTGGSTPSGGLEYETGTWTPNSDTTSTTISFMDTHTNPPMSITFYDATGTTDAPSGSCFGFSWIDFYQVGGQAMVASSSSTEWARAVCIAKTSDTAITVWTYPVNYPYSNTSSSSSTYYRYWVTESNFKPYANNASRYWRSGRTYKWIAVWAPTT